MEPVPFTRSSGHYRFPTASLSPVGALPSIDEAMYTGLAEAFNSSDAYLVDRHRHADFCVQAADAGYLTPEDLTEFAERPTLMALNTLAQKSVQELGRAFHFGKKNLFKNRHRLLTTLTLREANKETTAELALGLIQGGVLDASSLYTTVKKGDYTVPIISELINESLEHHSGLSDTTCGANIFVDGNTVKIEADMPTYYDFNLQPLPQELRHELSILLQKAVAAITLYVIPIHVPATFCGPHSYIGDEIYCALNELESRTSDFSVENLTRVLREIGYHNLPFEPEYFGIVLDDETNTFCEHGLVHGSKIFSQAHNMRTNYCHWLNSDGNRRSRAVELGELAAEARALAASGKKTARAGDALSQIFEFARCVLESGSSFDYEDWSGNYNDGLGLFETFVVRIDEDENPDVYAEGYNYVDCVMNEQAFTFLSVPIERDAVARKLVTIMDHIKEVHSSLRNVERVIEEIINAN